MRFESGALEYDGCTGPRPGSNIRVNAVAPGFIDGRWLRNGLGASFEVALKMYEDRLPLGRVCQPEDVAAAVISLITGSDTVTGQTIVCDSGMLIADFIARPKPRT